MPRVSFDASAPVVQVLSLRADGKPRIEAAIRNTGNEPVQVRAFLSDAWSHNPPRELTEELSLPPGAQRAVVLEPPHGGPE